MKILITGGGTGGHLYPGLELAKHFALQKHEIWYVASSKSIDKSIIESEEGLGKINFVYFDVTGLSREKNLNGVLYNLKALKKLLLCNKKAKKLLIDKKIDIVIGVGGYVSYSVINEAIKLNIKTIIHEQNSYPGLVNRKLSKKVDVLTGAYKKAENYFQREIINVSNPRVDEAIKYIDKKFYNELCLDENKEIVLFLGGSLGADTINNLFLEFIKRDTNASYQCVLISGRLNNEIEDINLKHNIVLEATNKLLKYLATSDYVISRGGATTLLEIIYMEKKSIIIPSPNVVANHQYYNALEFEEENLIYMIEEENLDFELFYRKFKLLKEDLNIKPSLKKYDKILSLEMFDNLIRR